MSEVVIIARIKRKFYDRRVEQTVYELEALHASEQISEPKISEGALREPPAKEGHER